jgi:Tfp pilus assembly protein PilF
MLRKAVELRPGNAQANFQLAKLVWQKSKDPEAAVYLDRATKADPEYREAFFLHATVLQALGRKAEAAKSFARVKELSAKALARQQDLFSETPTTAP